MGGASSISAQASASASSLSSAASSAASYASSLAASGSSSLSASASKSSASLSSAASKSASSASLSAASASASAAGKNPTLATTSTSTLSIIGIVFTALIATLIGLHFSGMLDPVYKWAMEKYFKAEAKAEMIALEKTGSKQAEGFLKEKLKGNPMADVGEDQLDDIAKGNSGLGKIAGGAGAKLGL